MKFDRKKFFYGYRQQFGPLSQQQVDGLNFILDAVEVDPYVTDVRWLAYMLATVKHETADTFQPIHEYGSHAYFVRRYGGQTALGKRLGNDTPEEGADYAGEGDVQLTGKSNFEKAEAALRQEYPELIAQFEARTGRKFDLTVGDQPNDKDDPKNAGDPAIAYAIMSFGMRTGMFTGRKLSDFLNAKRTDYKNARRIINLLDHAATIAGDANEFELILNDSKAEAEPAGDPADVNSDTDPKTANEGAVATSNDPSNSVAGPAQPSSLSPQTVEVARPSIKEQIAAAAAFVSGLGINAGELVQGKLEKMSLAQIGYLVVALGLCFFGVWWYRKAHKAANKMTTTLIEKAADPASHTVELKK